MLVQDANLIPKDYKCTISTESGGVVTEKLFYNLTRAEATLAPTKWRFKWVYTAIGAVPVTTDADIEVVINPDVK